MCVISFCALTNIKAYLYDYFAMYAKNLAIINCGRFKEDGGYHQQNVLGTNLLQGNIISARREVLGQYSLVLQQLGALAA